MRRKLQRVLKSALPLLVLLGVAGLAASLLRGDGCGPVERGLRAALGAWDMWETQRLNPQEAPLRLPPADTVQQGAALPPLEAARRGLGLVPEGQRLARGAEAYRRACGHCHGPNGDARVIVGESFAAPLADLRAEDAQGLTDEDLFEVITFGSGKMLALEDTLSPLERLLAIAHMRTLPGRPSVPFFPRRWLQPAEQPGGPPGAAPK
jgi:mono/diheme cytochrome c family protein